jgi:hypothetical protein
LDDLPHNPETTSQEDRAEVKAKGKEWFQHSDSFTGNLETAFKLFSAVSRFVFPVAALFTSGYPNYFS